MLGFALRFASNGARAYSPRVLFTQGQQGAWYDPSDLSTLFQDAAGTIPVTATGQPVGLMRDKSGRGNHATQATAASRPIFRDVGGLRYLECDGVDDGMVTGSIDFTGTDKMLAVVGVRKLSDSTMNMVLELTATVGSNNGGFAVYAPVTALENNIGAGSRGSALAVITNPPGATAAPASVVATASASISGDSVSIRANGGATYTNTTDQGAGNYANAPIYLFRRGGASSPFNGLFYGAVIAGAAYSAAQIASAERYLAGKSGVTL